MLTLTVNLTAAARSESINGRPYLVAPMTLIVPGVLNGSRGPLLYPPEEIERSVAAWNGVPLVLGHPRNSNGVPISARSLEILNRIGLGFVQGARTENGKLMAEGWFDVIRMKEVHPAALARLQGGLPLELSTGLNTDNYRATPGSTYNGRAYHAVARNYEPDHLAILPEDKGACSLNDGCGVLNMRYEDFNQYPQQLVHNGVVYQPVGPVANDLNEELLEEPTINWREWAGWEDPKPAAQPCSNRAATENVQADPNDINAEKLEEADINWAEWAKGN